VRSRHRPRGRRPALCAPPPSTTRSRGIGARTERSALESGPSSSASAPASRCGGRDLLS
jgi:hypothetical protein